MDEIARPFSYVPISEQEPVPSTPVLFEELTDPDMIQMQASRIDALLASTLRMDRRIETISAKIKALESGDELPAGPIEEDDIDELKKMYNSLVSQLQQKGPLWRDLAIKTVWPYRVAFDIDDPKAFAFVHSLLTGPRLLAPHPIPHVELPVIDSHQPTLILQADQATSIALPAANFLLAERPADRHIPYDAGTVIGYVQPNNCVLYHGVQGTMHQDAIAVRTVVLQKIDADIIPLKI